MSGTEKTTSGSLQDSTKFTNLDKSDGVFPSPDLRLSVPDLRLSVPECIALAQKHSISHGDGHDKVAQVIRWDLNGKCGFERTENWFYNKPDPVCDVRSTNCYWIMILRSKQTITLNTNKPDINKEDTNPVNYN